MSLQFGDGVEDGIALGFDGSLLRVKIVLVDGFHRLVPFRVAFHGVDLGDELGDLDLALPHLP